QESAGIAAQVEHQAAHAGLLQDVHDLGQLRGGCLRERRQADVGDLRRLVDPEIPLLQIGRVAAFTEHAVDVDLGAGDLQVDRIAEFLGAFVKYGQRYLGARLALNLFDDLFHGHVLGRNAVDFDDGVAGENAGLVGGRADHGAVHVNAAGA